MIKKLSPRDKEIVEQIFDVFQASYRIEANLLGVEVFPPLNRTVDNFMKSNTSFYGYLEGGELAAVIEIDELSHVIDVCSLVVSPSHFRKGIARKLLTYTRDFFPKYNLIVETGVDNLPAIQLYESFGFIEVKRWWLTKEIEKVKFELDVNM